MITMIFVFQNKEPNRKEKKRNDELMLPVAFDCSVGWRMLKIN